MRNRQQPLDQGKPPIEVSFYVGVIDLQVDGLLVDDGRKPPLCRAHQPVRFCFFKQGGECRWVESLDGEPDTQ